MRRERESRRVALVGFAQLARCLLHRRGLGAASGLRRSRLRFTRETTLNRLRPSSRAETTAYVAPQSTNGTPAMLCRTPRDRRFGLPAGGVGAGNAEFGKCRSLRQFRGTVGGHKPRQPLTNLTLGADAKQSAARAPHRLEKVGSPTRATGDGGRVPTLGCDTMPPPNITTGRDRAAVIVRRRETACHSHNSPPRAGRHSGTAPAIFNGGAPSRGGTTSDCPRARVQARSRTSRSRAPESCALRR